jgi:hypothetical protein
MDNTLKLVALKLLESDDFSSNEGKLYLFSCDINADIENTLVGIQDICSALDIPYEPDNWDWHIDLVSNELDDSNIKALHVPFVKLYN